MKQTDVAKPHLYHQVASQIEAMIGQGLLRAGDRIPSVRQMSKSKGVSIATVLEAYVLLENRGVIEARPQSGFYVKPPATSASEEPKRSRPTKAISQFTNGDFVVSLLQNGRDKRITQLGAATPHVVHVPSKSFSRILTSTVRNNTAEVNEYDMPPGNDRLRRLIAKRAYSYGCELSADDLITTVGGMEAVNLALLATTQPGDIVAVESPTYYGALQAIESFGRRTLEIPTTPQEGLCLDDLEAALTTKKIKAVFAMPNFSNPLGTTMPDAKKQALVQMLGKRDIPLIEDDVYGDLNHDGARPRPAKVYDKKGLVLLCSSFSKTISPGSRVGWIAPGARYYDKVMQLKFMYTMATPTLAQMAIAEFMENGGYDRHIRRMRAAYAMQIREHRAAIEKFFPEGTRITKPNGGFLLWVEMPASVDAFQLYEKALEERISVAPGPIFSAQMSFRHHLRINAGAPYSDKIERALKKLGELAKSLAK